MARSEVLAMFGFLWLILSHVMPPDWKRIKVMAAWAGSGYLVAAIIFILRGN